MGLGSYPLAPNKTEKSKRKIKEWRRKKDQKINKIVYKSIKNVFFCMAWVEVLDEITSLY